MTEVTKILAGKPIVLERFEYRKQRWHDVGHRHQIAEHEVQAMPNNVAAYEERVLVAAAADEADLALVGPGAAVGAARHADAKCLILQSQALQLGFQLVDEARQCPFRFGERQAASWNGGAGHAVLANARNRLRAFHAMLGQDLVDLLAGAGVEVAKENVLQRRQADVRGKALDDRAQSGAEAEIAVVLDPAVLDAQTIEKLAVSLRVPAEVWIEAGRLDVPWRNEGAADVVG